MHPLLAMTSEAQSLISLQPEAASTYRLPTDAIFTVSLCTLAGDTDFTRSPHHLFKQGQRGGIPQVVSISKYCPCSLKQQTPRVTLLPLWLALA